MFLAFPFEAFGTAAAKVRPDAKGADLVRELTGGAPCGQWPAEPAVDRPGSAARGTAAGRSAWEVTSIARPA